MTSETDFKIWVVVICGMAVVLELLYICSIFRVPLS